MKDVSNAVLKFLRARVDAEQSLLLGLSGGTDSLALFYLLLDCIKKVPFTFGVAHVDHGWRPESAEEASTLQKLAEKHSVPFHLKTLRLDGRSEEVCREERLSFFAEVCKSSGYHALLLAHHKGDQAETVLKNLFEGASLPSCNGIEESSKYGELRIWRPLLHIPKKKMSRWLAQRGIAPFDDETNRDPAFLRARMRARLLPGLEEMFGKGIEGTLASVGKESQELREFLLGHLSRPLETIVESDEAISLDLNAYPNLSVFECKFLIRQACKKASCFPSKEIVDDAAFHILEKQSKKQYFMGNTRLVVDKGILSVSN